MTLIFYHPPKFEAIHIEGRSKWEEVKRLDYVGILVFTAGATLLLLGLSWGGTSYPWTDAHVLAPLIIGIFTSLVVLPIWEFKLCPDYIDKLMPEAIFKGGLRTVVLPILTLFVSGMLYFSLQALWPQQIQLLFTRTPKTIGWYSCVLGATGVLGAFTSGAAFSKIKRTRVLFTTSIVIQTIFIGAMASVTSNTPVRAIIFVAFVGYGIGACQILGVLTVQLGAPGMVLTFPKPQRFTNTI